ncbi:MAG: hypothetical protein DDT40_01574 [candidate division WS2 bacterium]|nr:hypothetical protein [Candidatus Psychracetigena formicireducens]
MVITDRAMATGAINARDERLNRERLMSFLKDRRPKVLKDGAGRMYMVAIVAPREIPNNNLAQGICDIEFEWIQVGDLQSIDRWGV